MLKPSDLILSVAGDLLIDSRLFLETLDETPEIMDSIRAYYKGSLTYEALVEYVGGFF